ncbi:MAG: hypothetical protein KDA97_08880 [Acidimicrobiales bacterium]|nr:hypothetical protein [Acidimicrobiales bacterium]
MAPPPTLAELAELIHRSVADDGRPLDAGRFAYVRHRPGERLDLGLWPIPAGRWPCEPLMGFVAPSCWSAVALAVPGRAHHLGDDRSPPDGVVVTAIAGRDGHDASVLAIADRPQQVHDHRAPGLVSDVLARTLDRATPAPEHSTAALVELAWMERVAVGFAQPRPRTRSWRWLADRHPLRGHGPVPEPADLAIRTRAHAAAHSWAGLRESLRGATPPEGEVRPPGGESIDLAAWFDDGCLSRWMLRELPAAAATFEVVRDAVPAHAASALDEAVVALVPARAA